MLQAKCPAFLLCIERQIRKLFRNFVAMIRYLAAIILASLSMVISAKDPEIAPSRAWTMLPPLGLHQPSTIDTTLINYCQGAVPSEVSMAYATTGNLGAEGLNMLLFERQPTSQFFFRDAINHWLPVKGNHKFYNTRIPMTLVSYGAGGGRDNGQDRLTMDFSGNTGPKLQIGAMLDYLYSKGSYQNQAAKDLAWGLSSSYMGDRLEFQTFYNHYNTVIKENGGITDPLYITEPEVLQGGNNSINPKSIPTNLTNAHSRLRGEEFYLNSRYKVGYWHETPPNPEVPDDTVPHREYIAVSSFIWTLDFNRSRHVFNNTSEKSDFWEQTYFTEGSTHDATSYWSLSNTLGISLLEGFHKYAKAGLAAYLTHEIRRFNQTPDTIPSGDPRLEHLTPYPFDERVAPHATENLLWVGGQLTKQQGKLLRYDVTGQFGLIGPSAADFRVDGNVSTQFKLFGDTVRVTAYGSVSNEAAPYLLNHYVSNHFIWENDFGKTRRVKFGGHLTLPFSGTYINAGVENIQNLIYFNSHAMPEQHGGNVQVVSASVHQDFKVGILNWQNKVTYQTTTAPASVLPAPKLALYSNLFLLFKVARVLHVQLGVDCDYYTRYKAPSFQPATMSFYNAPEVEIGNYPFMNAYANMKLSKARFYVLFSHVNQGLTGRNYFSLPNYPLNPRRFQIGVSVDFAN